MTHFRLPTSAVAVYFGDVDLYGGAAMAIFNGPSGTGTRIGYTQLPG